MEDENTFLEQNTEHVSIVHTNSIQYGAFAMVLFAVVGLTSNILLPLVISLPKQKVSPPVTTLTHEFLASPMISSLGKGDIVPYIRRNHALRPLQLSKILGIISSPYQLTLPAAWTASHF
jgi:hypothetical protein